MKKVIRYMQNQAVQYSEDKYNNASYLSPRGNKEPQQRTRHSGYKSHHITHATSRSSNPSAHAHSFPHHVSGASGPFPIPHSIQKVQYGSDNILQSYEVYVPERTPDPIEKAARDNNSPNASGFATPIPKYWVIYIHGGYFRDPKVDATSFHPALAQLVNPSSDSDAIREVQSHIAGYASINYRLAPHSNNPQPDETPPYEKRNATWPEPMTDVLTAIKNLQSKHGFGERYLLVGHSVGATMALLACMKAAHADILAPIAVLGVCGIYDFPALHKDHVGYDSLTRNIMPDESDWVKASPANFTREQIEAVWARGQKRWVLLAQSKGDTLVDFGQASGMERVLEGNGGKGEAGVLVDLVEVKGGHNEVWEKGTELARVVAAGVGEMIGIDQ